MKCAVNGIHTSLLEKAREIDPFGHAGFDPSGKIRLTPKKSWRRGSTLFYLI